jgi:hypothetical protein
MFLVYKVIATGMAAAAFGAERRPRKTRYYGFMRVVLALL